MGTGQCPSAADAGTDGSSPHAAVTCLPLVGAWEALEDEVGGRESRPKNTHVGDIGSTGGRRPRGAPTSWGWGVGLSGDKHPVEGQQGQQLGSRNVRTALSCLRENADGNFSIVCVLPEREHRGDA